MRRHGRLSRPATSSSVPHARYDSRPARVRRGGIAADRRGRWEFLPRETAPSSPDRVRDVVPFGDVRGAGVSRSHAVRAGAGDSCIRSCVRPIRAREYDGPRGEPQRLDADDEPGPSPRASAGGTPPWRGGARGARGGRRGGAPVGYLLLPHRAIPPWSLSLDRRPGIDRDVAFSRRWPAQRRDRPRARGLRGNGRHGRGVRPRQDPITRDASNPSADSLHRAAAVPRVLRGARTAREPGHHADGYSPTSCGGGGALSLTPTSGGTPTTVFASVPFRRSS